MSTESNKTLIRNWFEEGWNKGNLSAVDKYYAPNFVQHDPNSPVPVTSSEALKGYIAAYRGALPDLHFTLDDVFAEGDRVLARFTSTGTQTGPLGNIPASGKAGVVTGMVVFRVAGDKIAEAWVNADILGLLQQIGVIPVMA